MSIRRGRRKAGLSSARLSWIGAAATPWIAGIGLLVSFTATAGTESSIGSSVLTAPDVRMVPPLPPGVSLIGAVEVEDGASSLYATVRGARHLAEEPVRADLKLHARTFPVIQRGAKGDALVAPGRSFEQDARRLREGGPSLIFANLTGSVTGVLSPGSATWNPDLEPESGFQPVPDLGLTVGAGAPPSAGEPVADIVADDPHDGSTPAIPRAVALGSTTPAPADATPIEVAAASLALPGFSFRDGAAKGTSPMQTVIPESAAHRYADLIDPESMDKEQRCLAEAVYFEARSEPEEGQAAVAQVVLNRVKSGLYPASVCGVVYQNRHRYMACQFSFACEGKSLRITDASSWQSATRIARSVIEGKTYLADVGGATHYHADYVKPGWSRRLIKMDVIGRHIFYQLKRGQT